MCGTHILYIYIFRLCVYVVKRRTRVSIIYHFAYTILGSVVGRDITRAAEFEVRVVSDMCMYRERERERTERHFIAVGHKSRTQMWRRRWRTQVGRFGFPLFRQDMITYTWLLIKLRVYYTANITWRVQTRRSGEQGVLINAE